MNKLKKDILPIVRSVAEKLGYLLIEFEVKGNRNNPIFEVFVDGKSPITTDDCSLISRKIEEEIDSRENVELKKYRLDVSSPGVDRPLKFIEQFEKHVGGTLKLKLNPANRLKILKENCSTSTATF